MNLGALLSVFDGSDPDSITNQAQNLESAGYKSIWSAQAVGRGFMMTDPFIALSVVASVTQRVELGTAILQLPLYNPTDVAVKAMSLQQVSGNRLILGVGAGSTKVDFQVHNLNFENRFLSFESHLTALRGSLSDGKAGNGNLNPWSSVQDGPPIFFGTWGKNVTRAATEFDGWIASGMHRTPEQCAAAMLGYKAAGGNRAIVSTIQVTPKEDLGRLKAKLDAYADAGFDDAVVMFMPGAQLLDEVMMLV